MKTDWCLYWDGYGLGAPNSGIFVHAANLAKELCAMGIVPHLVGEESALAHLPFLPGIPIEPSKLMSLLPANKIFWHLGVSRAIRNHRAGNGAPVIVHGLSNFNVPLGSRVPWRRVLTVHDLIPMLVPDQVSKTLYWQLRAVLPHALDAADRIICVSQWTRRTLTEFMPKIAEKICVIPNGLHRHDVVQKPVFASRKNIGLLFVARYEPYKGHQTLVDLLRGSKLPITLDVITDTKGVAFWRERCDEAVVAKRLRVRSGVYGDELMAAYSEADIYISPSQFEGFCLPAIEALNAGTPVVYRPGSGIDEVAGDEVSVAVENYQELISWDRAIESAINIACRQDFSSRLDKYLRAQPTWKDGASKLLSLYNELV